LIFVNDLPVEFKAEQNRYLAGNDEITNAEFLKGLTSGQVTIGTGTFSGRVQTSASQGISGATVAIESTFPPTRLDTDDNGAYIFVAFPGSYDLKASATGFQTQEKQDHTVGLDGTTQVFFTLSPLGTLPGVYGPQIAIQAGMESELLPLRDLRDWDLIGHKIGNRIATAYYARSTEEMLAKTVSTSETIYPAGKAIMRNVLMLLNALPGAFFALLFGLFLLTIRYRRAPRHN